MRYAIGAIRKIAIYRFQYKTLTITNILKNDTINIQKGNNTTRHLRETLLFILFVTSNDYISEEKRRHPFIVKNKLLLH